MLRNLLLLNNPWWEGEESFVLREWRSREIKWRPGWLNDLSLEPYSLNFVIGPRMVGKTTGLHILIEELLKKGIDPRSILYLNLDLAADVNAFRTMLREYLDMRSSLGIERSYIFLDEVTSLRGWWRVVKGYVDAGVFRSDVLVLTGSSSLRLRGEVELFPGRMGRGREVVAWPLSFRQYLSVRGINVPPSDDPVKGMRKLLPLAGRISHAFEDYLRTGGYPLPVNGDPRALEYMIRSVEGEVLRAGRDLGIARAVISSILRKAPSPVSYLAIGKEISVSHRTVREYVELFRQLMILEQALFIEGGRIAWRKERKFFFLDPFVSRTMSIWTATPHLEGVLHEWVVQSHLLRKYGSVHYHRDRYEVDAIAGGMRIEVKAGKPHRRYPKDVIVLDAEDLPLFLAAL